MRAAISLSISIIFLFSSCKPANPRLTNSHAGKFIVKKNFDSISNILNVYAAIVPIEPTKKAKEKEKTFFDLRDSIPHTYINALADKIAIGKASDLVDLLKKPLSDLPKKDTKPGVKTDYATQKVKFVIGNVKNYHLLASDKNPEFAHPNTRLTALNTTLDFSKTDFHILSINKLESEFEYIDIGTLSRTQEANFTSKLTGQYGITNSNSNVIGDSNSSESNSSTSVGSEKNVYDENGNLLGAIKLSDANSSILKNSNSSSNTKTKGLNASVNGEIGYSNKEAIAEALAVKLKRLKTGFVFNKDQITITQHGSNLIDVSDNVIVTATIYPKDVSHDDVFNFIGLFASDLPQNADKITFKSRNIKYFDCYKKSVNVTINANGMLRAVQNKVRGDNILEFDDKVIYYPFENLRNTNTTQINQWASCLNLYEIHHNDGKDAYVLYIKQNNEEPKPLRFMDNEAEKLFIWLRMMLKDPKAVNLKSDDVKIFFKQIVQKVSKALPKKKKIVDKSFESVELTNIKDLNIRLKKVFKRKPITDSSNGKKAGQEPKDKTQPKSKKAIIKRLEEIENEIKVLRNKRLKKEEKDEKNQKIKDLIKERTELENKLDGNNKPEQKTNQTKND